MNVGFGGSALLHDTVKGTLLSKIFVYRTNEKHNGALRCSAHPLKACSMKIILSRASEKTQTKITLISETANFTFQEL
jgi:hypothetical protein